MRWQWGRGKGASVVMLIAMAALGSACGDGSGAATDAPEGAGAAASDESDGNAVSSSAPLGDLDVCGMVTADAVSRILGTEMTESESPTPGGCGWVGVTGVPVASVTAVRTDRAATDLRIYAEAQANIADAEVSEVEGLAGPAFSYELFGGTMLVFAAHDHVVTINVTGGDDPAQAAVALARVVEAA